MIGIGSSEFFKRLEKYQTDLDIIVLVLHELNVGIKTLPVGCSGDAVYRMPFKNINKFRAEVSVRNSMNYSMQVA